MLFELNTNKYYTYHSLAPVLCRCDVCDNGSHDGHVTFTQTTNDSGNDKNSEVPRTCPYDIGDQHSYLNDVNLSLS